MKRGFTLVELSIALVIIGLLIGGILAAQSMIQTAKIQSQVRQFQQFDIAITNFHTKFNQIPGDCSICNHNQNTTDGNNHEGNNDGLIKDCDGNLPETYMCDEGFFFFIDLYNMGMISTQYKYEGTQGGGAASNLQLGDGHQFPSATIGRGGWLIIGNAQGNLYFTSTHQGFTAPNNGRDFYDNIGSFSAAEALAIDTKIDDGLPSTGNVSAWDQSTMQNAGSTGLPMHPDANGGYYGGMSVCVTNDATRQYNLSLQNNGYSYGNYNSGPTAACRLQIKSNFN